MKLCLAEVAFPGPLACPKHVKSRDGRHHLHSWQRRPQPFIFAWCLQSIQLHLENIIHGAAWQIIYLLAYCSKLVSRWGFRFSILSQRKMNKEQKAPKIPHPSLPTSRCSASAVCELHLTHLLYFSPPFCCKGEMRNNSSSDISSTQMLGPLLFLCSDVF